MTQRIGMPFATTAFGLNLRLPFSVGHLPERPHVSGWPGCEAEWIAPEDLEALCSDAGPGVVLAEVRSDGGGERLDVQRLGELHRFRLTGVGACALTADGRLLCAPIEPGGRAAWERLLLAQVLPLAALLGGYEVLHASAVDVAGRAVALVGHSGSGKSTLAAHLVAAGATARCDDVVAVRLAGDRVLAHSGPGELRLDAAGLDGLSRRDGRLDAAGKLCVPVATDASPAPLAAVYFLRRPARADAVTVRTGGSVRDLLGATFNVMVETPERLRRHFELCLAILASVPTFEVLVPAGADPTQVTDVLAAHAGTR